MQLRLRTPTGARLKQENSAQQVRSEQDAADEQLVKRVPRRKLIRETALRSAKPFALWVDHHGMQWIPSKPRRSRSLRRQLEEIVPRLCLLQASPCEAHFATLLGSRDPPQICPSFTRFARQQQQFPALEQLQNFLHHSLQRSLQASIHARLRRDLKD